MTQAERVVVAVVGASYVALPFSSGAADMSLIAGLACVAVGLLLVLLAGCEAP